jgi:putative sterol carrier protein
LSKKSTSNPNIKDYTRNLHFIFSDADPYWVKIVEGKVEFVEKVNRKQDSVATVTCNVEVMQKILEGKMSSIQALLTRKVKVDGSLSVIRELRQKVLGDFQY